MKIEICANSFISAQNALKGGATRIELCENLSVGGLTPSKELMRKVIEEVGIEAHVLIRPRAGDFNYTENEIIKMQEDIAYCKRLGFTGIVSGALTSKNEIDVITTNRLIKASEGMQFTFHRAFDVCENAMESLKILMHLGVTRLLSSGQQLKAIDGIALLKDLQTFSEGKIEIMPGSGISSENALTFKEAGFNSIHFSAIKKEPSKSSNDMFNATIKGHSNLSEIQKVVRLLAE